MVQSVFVLRTNCKQTLTIAPYSQQKQPTKKYHTDSMLNTKMKTSAWIIWGVCFCPAAGWLNVSGLCFRQAADLIYASR